MASRRATQLSRTHGIKACDTVGQPLQLPGHGSVRRVHSVARAKPRVDGQRPERAWTSAQLLPFPYSKPAAAAMIRASMPRLRERVARGNSPGECGTAAPTRLLPKQGCPCPRIGRQPDVGATALQLRQLRTASRAAYAQIGAINARTGQVCPQSQGPPRGYRWERVRNCQQHAEPLSGCGYSPRLHSPARWSAAWLRKIGSGLLVVHRGP
jgi:hypothetical protein